MPHKKTASPTLNIWQVQEYLRIKKYNETIELKKHEFLFLVKRRLPFYTFKSEQGKTITLPENYIKNKSIIKVF